MTTSNYDLTSGDWKLVHSDEYCRRYHLDLGNGQIVQRTEWLATEQILEDNARRYNDSEGKRWGDGQIVASIPLNQFYAELAPYLREGDKDHAKWWLNRDENRKYRTFKGTV